MGLVIARKPDEKVILTCPNGDEIVIRVHEIEGQRLLRLDIDAPKSISILREELK